MVTVVEMFESSELILLDFCLRYWAKSEVGTRKVDVRDELLALILDTAARINKLKNQLRRVTRRLRTRVAKYIEVDCGILEHFCEL